MSSTPPTWCAGASRLSSVVSIVNCCRLRAYQIVERRNFLGVLFVDLGFCFFCSSRSTAVGAVPAVFDRPIQCTMACSNHPDCGVPEHEHGQTVPLCDTCLGMLCPPAPISAGR
ncbi:unnamed protein product [Ectocarpus sp. 8 AP-2014]